MDSPSFRYVTYIRTTAERLWAALTEPDFTAQYWAGHRVISDFQPGSPIEMVGRGGDLMDSGRILVAEPPRRLVWEWRVEFDPRLTAMGFSRVSFELEPQGDVVRLTLVHDDFDPGSTLPDDYARGWPMVLSSLKSLLESGRGLEVFGEAAADEAREEIRARLDRNEGGT